MVDSSKKWDAPAWNAADYAKNSSAQLGWATELIAKLALTGDEALLDIGCGDGKVTAQLAAAVPGGRALGIDNAPSMIQLATDTFPPDQYPTLAFRLMDATVIRLDREFDVAFSNAALHWVRDHRAVLQGVRACLKRGGRVLFQMGGRGNAAAVSEAMARITQAPRWRAYFTDFAPPYAFLGTEDYAQLLPACGFVAERIELIAKDMVQRGTEGFLGWLRTTWFPYTDCLPPAQREPFLRQVIDAYIERAPLDGAGDVHVGMVRLEIQARAEE